MAEANSERGRDAILRSYRRFLIDMHVPDWDGGFMARVDPKEIAASVARAGATVITVPANNHAGLNFWPSEVGTMHRGPGCGQLLPRLLDASAAEGLRTVIYYCISYVDWYWQHHPEARIVDARGRPRRIRVASTGEAERFGVCCTNDAGYRVFVLAQLKELAGWYQPDGVNLDMTVWPGVCFCRSCRERAVVELGFDVPGVVDWQDDRWLRFAAARRNWMAEFVEQATATVRDQRGDLSVTHQSGGYVNDWGAGSSERLSRSADWLSADLYQDRATLSVSLKLFESLSRYRPAELIHSWCSPTIFEHSATKTAEEISGVAAAAISNGTALSIIEAINPDGSISLSRYERARVAFDLVSQLEPVLGGTRQSDVALYRSFAGNFDLGECGLALRDQTFIGEPGYRTQGRNAHRSAIVRAGEAFLERQVLFSVATRLDLDRLERWKVVFVPNLSLLDEDEQAGFLAYVRDGGVLYLSLSGLAAGCPPGKGALKLLRDLLDIEVLGSSQEAVSYVVPSDGSDLLAPFSPDRPYTVHATQLFVSSPATNSFIHGFVGLPYSEPRGSVYASVLTDPLGRVTAYPALVERAVGKGRVLFAAGPIEAEGATEQRQVIANIVRSLLGGRESLHVEAPRCIEVTSYRRADLGATLLYFLNSQVSAPPVPVHGIGVTVVESARPVSVCTLPDGGELRWECDSQGLHFELPTCETLAVVRIEW